LLAEALRDKGFAMQKEPTLFIIVGFQAREKQPYQKS
jgi:hypothetical protein